MKHCYSAEMLFDYLLELKEHGKNLNDIVVAVDTSPHVARGETYHGPSVNFRYLPAGSAEASVWDAEDQLVIGVGV